MARTPSRNPLFVQGPMIHQHPAPLQGGHGGPQRTWVQTTNEKADVGRQTRTEPHEQQETRNQANQNRCSKATEPYQPEPVLPSNRFERSSPEILDPKCATKVDSLPGGPNMPPPNPRTVGHEQKGDGSTRFEASGRGAGGCCLLYLVLILAQIFDILGSIGGQPRSEFRRCGKCSP